MKLIFHTKNRYLRLSIMALVLLAGGVWLFWFGLDIYQSLGLNPADGYGGVLAPWSDRVAFAGLLFALGVGCIGGLWVFLRVYVRQIVIADDGSLVCSFLPPYGDVCLAREDIRKVSTREGRFSGTSAPSVDAPYVLIHRTNRLLPLILDAQGEFPGEAELRSVLRTLN